jgi:hydrophobic/amphiphilic exporter-1 (mainly G- bacteria), HAE1 family
VVKFDINAAPIVNLAISGARSLQEVYELADNQIRDELSKVSGVTAIEIVGGHQRQILVSLERERMHIRLHSGEMVELRELGQVLDTFAEVRELARFENKNAVGMSIKKQGDANTVATAVGIRQALETLRERLPQDIQISIARENASFIEDSVADVIQNIFIGILLTAILLYLFTHSWQATLIAALSVPTSLIATLLLIDFAGFSINVMTLMALSVAIDVLVTNALVVIENIINHIDRGDEAGAAAETGTREIAIGGVLLSAVFTLFVIPVFYVTMDKLARQPAMAD